MNIHYIQHVPFESLGKIETWAKNSGHKISGSHLYRKESLPNVGDFDLLIILGGPMSVHDEEKYQWLIDEKYLIEKAIEEKKKILGICLGSQLIADVLGSSVYESKYKEIGWFPVTSTKKAKKSSLFYNLPDKYTVFHWHGDTFDIPNKAIRMAKSKGCKNQAFTYNDGKVIGLQFHLESSQNTIEDLLKNSKDHQDNGKYIQSVNKILSQKENLKQLNKNLKLLLNNIEKI